MLTPLTPSAGVGTNLTALNASNLSSGTVAVARGGVDQTAFSTWSPTVSCGSGTFTTLGTVVARYSVRMSDNSRFTGTVRFGPPYYDSDGRFALVDNNIIVNPKGPGIGPNKATITDHITLEAVPESRAGR